MAAYINNDFNEAHIKLTLQQGIFWRAEDLVENHGGPSL